MPLHRVPLDGCQGENEQIASCPCLTSSPRVLPSLIWSNSDLVYSLLPDPSWSYFCTSPPQKKGIQCVCKAVTEVSRAVCNGQPQMHRTEGQLSHAEPLGDLGGAEWVLKVLSRMKGRGLFGMGLWQPPEYHVHSRLRI
jgi:hypothetical protein